METQMDAHSCCSNLPRWLRASKMWLGSNLKYDTKGKKQNRTKFGNVRKRGQEMGWVRDAERKQRGIKAQDKKGGRHKERKWREHRGEWRRNLHSQVVGERKCPSCPPPADSPSASPSTPPDTTQADWASPLALKRCRDSAKLLCGQSCQIFRHVLKIHLESLHLLL